MSNSKNIFNRRLKYQREIVDVTVFVNVKIKIYYDARHQSIFLQFDDKIYLKLHQNYNLLDRFNKKMFNQRCEFFIVKRRVDRLVYELKLFAHWRVYSIIFVIQLKSFSDKIFYNRFRFDYSNFVEMKNDTNDWRSYTMKRIVDKRFKKFERIIVTQYMIKWLNYESKYNECVKINARATFESWQCLTIAMTIRRRTLKNLSLNFWILALKSNARQLL